MAKTFAKLRLILAPYTMKVLATGYLHGPHCARVLGFRIVPQHLDAVAEVQRKIAVTIEDRMFGCPPGCWNRIGGITWVTFSVNTTRKPPRSRDARDFLFETSFGTPLRRLSPPDGTP